MKNKLVRKLFRCQNSATEEITYKSGHICCPGCGHRQSYKLSDGRRQCKQCRKKFTPHNRKPRLSKDKLAVIALSFECGMSAHSAAEFWDVNYKTVLKYYARFREMTAEFTPKDLETIRALQDAEADTFTALTEPSAFKEMFKGCG